MIVLLRTSFTRRSYRV